MIVKSVMIYLCCLILGGCFVNFPVYYDDIVKTDNSLTDFVDFAKQNDIRYQSSIGSTRSLGATSSGMIVTESYGDILEDQIPGKAGIDIQKTDYKELSSDFFGAQTGLSPVHLKGRMMKKGDRALIIIHGLLFSKRTWFIKEFAKIAHSDWGFTVVTVDLRGHGESLVYPEMSLGIYEALDICYLAKKLKRDYGMKYVGLVGFSLGAHTTIRTLYEASWEAKASGGPPVIDAGIAISPPSDMKKAFKDLDSTGIGYITNNFFHGVFQERICYLKEYGFLPEEMELENFKDFLNKVIIPHYKKTVTTLSKNQQITKFRNSIYQESYKYLNKRVKYYQQLFASKIHNYKDLLKLASTYKLLPQIKIPLLVIHGKDDTTISVEQSQLIAKEVKKNKLKNILVMIVPDGGHIAMHKVDPNWTFNMVYGFHYFYSYPKKRDDFEYKADVCSLWYYFDRVFDVRQFCLLWTLF